MTDVYGRPNDPQFFRDLVRLFRAARAVRNAIRTLTERQRDELMHKWGMGTPLASLIAAVEMLESYTRKPRDGE